LYVNKKQFRKAKDISNKRNIPVFDALHAIIARDNSAVMITRDRHFDKLLDIVRYKKPEEIII
jgi:predicted nucleic acid-binding protein